jgi:hypothetical protein
MSWFTKKTASTISNSGIDATLATLPFRNVDDFAKIFTDHIAEYPYGTHFEQHRKVIDIDGKGYSFVANPVKYLALKPHEWELPTSSRLEVGFPLKTTQGRYGVLLTMDRRNNTTGKSWTKTDVVVDQDDILLKRGETLDALMKRLGFVNGNGHGNESLYSEPIMEHGIIGDIIFPKNSSFIDGMGWKRGAFLTDHFKDKVKAINKKGDWDTHSHYPTDSEWNDLIQGRDALPTPADVREMATDGTQHSTIVLFDESNAIKSILTLDTRKLSQNEKDRLFALAKHHHATLEYHFNELVKPDILEVVECYELVDKALVEGIPTDILADRAM